MAKPQDQKSETHKKGRQVYQENEMLSELKLNTYSNRVLVDAIKELTIALNRNKRIVAKSGSYTSSFKIDPNTLKPKTPLPNQHKL